MPRKYDPTKPIPKTTLWRRENEIISSSSDDEIPEVIPMEVAADVANKIAMETDQPEGPNLPHWDMLAEAETFQTEQTEPQIFQPEGEAEFYRQGTLEIDSEEPNVDDEIEDSDEELMSEPGTADQPLLHENQQERAEFDSDDETEEDGEQKIFPGSTISVFKAIFLLMAMYFKHKITKSLLIDIIAFINAILPKNHLFPKSFHHLKQFLIGLGPEKKVTRHYFEIRKNEDNLNDYLLNYLGTSKPKKKKNIGTFYEIDAGDQIRHHLEKGNLAGKLKQPVEGTNGIFSDVTDGLLYKQVNLARGENDLTFILNTDGLEFSESSKIDCWPVLLKYCELPPFLRDSYLIMCGLWCSKVKPNMDLFLTPICQNIARYVKEGVKWINPVTKGEEKSNISVPLVSTDTPARADLQNIQHHMGTAPCNDCEIQTVQSERVMGKNGRYKKRVRIFPFVKISQLKLRTLSNMRKYARIAGKLIRNNRATHYKGVKGKSVLSLIPNLDISRCFAPEIMHSVFIGIPKQFLTHWLKKVSGAWRKNNILSFLNSKLLAIKPPHTFTRLPRVIDDFRKFKATEWFYFLVFYSLPIFKNLMKENYFQHLCGLVIALNLVLKETITEDDLTTAEWLLQNFVEQLQVLYDDRMLTSNMHLLLHLVQGVRKSGPPWATSAFGFENFNGFLASMTHATKLHGEEIMNNLNLLLGYEYLKNKINSETAQEPEPKKNNFLTLAKFKKTRRPLRIEDLKRVERDVFRQKFGPEVEGKIFTRAKVNGQIFTSTYYKTIATNSFTVEGKANGIDFYGLVTCFFKTGNSDDNSEFYLMLRHLKVDEDKIFHHAEAENHFNKEVTVEHILPVVPTDRFEIISVSDVESIQHLVNIGNGFVCKQPFGTKFIM